MNNALDKLEGKYAGRVKKYIDNVLNKKRPHCREDFRKVKRFIDFLNKYEVRPEEADEILLIGEAVFKFVDGDDKNGYSLANKPFRWLDWQIFDIYAIFIFYHPGTNNRVTKEAYIQVARKSGKTTYVDAIGFSLALKEAHKGGVPIGIVSATLDYADNLYKIIEQNIIGWYNSSKLAAQRDGWTLLNNNQDKAARHMNFGATELRKGGIIDIEVYSAKSEGVHSLRKKLVIIDELHLMRHGAAVHTQMRKSTANFLNGLSITITTAAIDKNNYCYDYTEFAKKVLNGKIEKDSLYVHIAKADEDEEGNVDIMDEHQWYKANPSLGEALPVNVIREQAEEALNLSTEARMQFLAYSLNIFQNKVSSEFQPGKFITSDMEYNWTLEELASLPGIVWYGGVDLSLYDDLTASALYGEYGDVGIIIPHGWAPRSEATTKAGEQGMDIYRWEEDGFFTFNESETNDPLKVVDWFIYMRDLGFNIGEIGYDSRYVTDEFKGELVKNGFSIITQRQTYSDLSTGFRHLEEKAWNSKIYYLHAGLYEYSLDNLLVISKRNNEVEFTKKDKKYKIDPFAASVFAAVRKVRNYERETNEEALEEYLKRALED